MVHAISSRVEITGLVLTGESAQTVEENVDDDILMRGDEGKNQCIWIPIWFIYSICLLGSKLFITESHFTQLTHLFLKLLKSDIVFTDSNFTQFGVTHLSPLFYGVRR